MKGLKIDFSKDFYTKEEIDLKKYLCIVKDKRRERGVTVLAYYSEAAEQYYREKYNKEIEFVLSEFFEIPKCPIKNKPVKLRLTGIVNFQKFCRECSNTEIQLWAKENNQKVKEFREKMKIERKGKGNPFYGLDPWNKGEKRIFNKKVDNSLRKKKQTELKRTDEENKKIKLKQSRSAKKRLVHGHTGIKHSEKTKQILREKTLKRLKENKFPQTNTLPMRIFRDVLLKLDVEFEEEFKIEFWSFDFKVKEFLIEVQGDYWHSNPLKYPNGPKTKGQKVNYLRDKRKKEYIEKLSDYKLIEVWENDLVKNIKEVELCMKKLLK